MEGKWPTGLLMIADIPAFDSQIPTLQIVQKVEEPEKPPEVFYTIKLGDNLTKIGEAYNVPVSRLWAANLQLANPDLIEPDKPLKIPQTDEILPERAMISTQSTSPSVVGTAVISGSSSSGGNLYSKGYCTWYVKSQKPSVPNDWHDASNWLRAAQADGWSTGSTPQVGAIAWTKSYSHVSLVIAIDGDSVTVREMNFKGWNVVSTRTTSAGEFLYIYG